jgi:hypothetical protein
MLLFCIVSYNDTVFVLFTNVWVGIVLVPLVEIADIPWLGCVQLKATPRLALFNVTKAEESPEQIVWLDGEKSDYRWVL